MWSVILKFIAELKTPERKILILFSCIAIVVLWTSFQADTNDIKQEKKDCLQDNIRKQKTIDSLNTVHLQEEQESNIKLRYLIESQNRQKELLKEFYEQHR
jgi:hypothetical protein